MPRNPRLSTRDALDAFRLVHECLEIGRCSRADPLAWQHHLLDGVRRLTRQAGALYAELRPLRVGQPPAFSRTLDVGWRDDAARRHYLAYLRQLPTDADPFPNYPAVVRRVHERGHAAFSREHLCPDPATWNGSRFFNDFRRPAGQDGLVMSFVAGTGGWSHLAVHQDLSDSPPTTRDRRLVSLVHRALDATSRTACRFDVPADGLTPRLRETLGLLLEGLPEKLVADRLGVSRHTAHEYVGKIYLHYRVRSRAELMARLL